MTQQRGTIGEPDDGCGCKVEWAAERYDSERVNEIFVSHQTVHSLQNRMRLVTEETMERPARADVVALDSFDVYVDTTIVCDTCDRSLSFPQLLDREECRCQVAKRDDESPTLGANGVAKQQAGPSSDSKIRGLV